MPRAGTPPSGAMDATCISDCRALLGEGPVWVVSGQALYWVDIEGKAIFRRDAAGDVVRWDTPLRIGSLVPRSGGGLVAGTERGFAFVDPASGTYEIFANPEPGRAKNRFNDGKVDRSGIFWAGTMADGGSDPAGALYRLDGDLVWSRADDGYRVTNGPAFSPDGRLLYHSDSGLRTIYVFDLAGDGTISGKRVFARFAPSDGHPDGMTVDADGCLWVAFWDGWCVRRISPVGETLLTVRLPVQRPTSCAFGGPALDRLYVTSARIDLGDGALSKQPQAGGLFALEPGCTGLAELPFAG